MHEPSWMRSAVYVFFVNEMNTLNGLMRHDEVVLITSDDWHAIAVKRTFFQHENLAKF